MAGPFLPSSGDIDYPSQINLLPNFSFGGIATGSGEFCVGKCQRLDELRAGEFWPGGKNVSVPVG
ncbi:hypothetical protein BH09VER1_BH09VER1_06110 [soil metagenome]